MDSEILPAGRRSEEQTREPGGKGRHNPFSQVTALPRDRNPVFCFFKTLDHSANAPRILRSNDHVDEGSLKVCHLEAFMLRPFRFDDSGLVGVLPIQERYRAMPMVKDVAGLTLLALELDPNPIVRAVIARASVIARD